MVKKEKGITLVALVVTIIVLLILAGVTINTLMGDDSIIERATNSAIQTEIGKEQTEVDMARSTILLDKAANNDKTNISVAELQKQMDLNAGKDVTEVYLENGMLIVKYVESTRTYEVNPTYGSVIDWDSVIENAKAHEEQDTILNPDIGIGTDGKPVNLDNWYYYETDGEISLGKLPYDQYGSYANTAVIGYIGEIINGKIEGTIPQYIIIDGTAYPVVKLDATFKNITTLTEAPEIPSTVKQMHGTFNGCTGLLRTPKFPTQLESLGDSTAVNNDSGYTGAFYGCTSLKTVEELPKTLQTMDFAFARCSALEGTLQFNSIGSAFNILYNAATSGNVLYISVADSIDSAEAEEWLLEILDRCGSNSQIEIKE